jgi:hypothetical protein
MFLGGGRFFLRGRESWGRSRCRIGVPESGTAVLCRYNGQGIEGSGEFAAVAASWFEEGEEIGHAQEAAEGWVCVG